MQNIFGVMDDHGGSFKDYFINNNMPDKISKLKKGLDKTSIDIVDMCLHRMLHLPDLSSSKHFFVNISDYMDWLETDREKFFRESYEYSLPNFKLKYNLDGEAYNPDTFLFHHGLFFSNQNIKNYIKDRVFIDGGAFIGDSALVMYEYNPKKIYSFDLSEKNVNKYKEIMQLNNIPEERFQILLNGLSDKRDIIKINDCGGQGVNLNWKGENTVECISIDDFVDNINQEIGFIKCDLEGNGLKALKGMQSTIKRYRPVLTLAIYHNPEEFFEMKPLLDDITRDSNYIITINHYHCFCDFLAEISIFAYPAELKSNSNSNFDKLILFKNHPLYSTIKTLWDSME